MALTIKRSLFCSVNRQETGIGLQSLRNWPNLKTSYGLIGLLNLLFPTVRSQHNQEKSCSLFSKLFKQQLLFAISFFIMIWPLGHSAKMLRYYMSSYLLTSSQRAFIITRHPPQRKFRRVFSLWQNPCCSLFRLNDEYSVIRSISIADSFKVTMCGFILLVFPSMVIECQVSLILSKPISESIT